MTILEMIEVWRGGCSIAGPEHDIAFGKPEGTTCPSECSACTVGLIDAIEKAIKNGATT